jgi:molecular chaperone DnaK
LKEYGDKIPADKKQPIEEALKELKDAHQKQEVEKLDSLMEKLNTVFQAVSQHMYQGQGANGSANAQQNGASNNTQNTGSNDEVTDVDFEEVDENK